MRKHSSLLLLCLVLYNSAINNIYAQDMNAPILARQIWERYGNEAEAIAKAENGSALEKRKAAVTLFLLSRDEVNKGNKKKGLELVKKASTIMNRIYRRNRNDFTLALLSGMINMGVAGTSSKLKDRISYSNRGLANYEFVLPNVPNNLEAKQIYLRTTIQIPTFFKNLTKEQLQRANDFLNQYEDGLAKLQSPEERKRLEELKTHVLILIAKLSDRSRHTRGDVAKYLAQVNTAFFDTMKRQSNADLVEMYYELKE